jgi:hypothetical protein
VQLETQKASHAQRIGGAPSDRALGIEPFKVPKQQHAKVPPRWQTRTPDLVGVEPLTERLDVTIEGCLVQNLIQSRVERVRDAPRQVLRGHPHGRWFGRRRRLPIAMRDTVVRRIGRVDRQLEEYRPLRAFWNSELVERWR